MTFSCELIRDAEKDRLAGHLAASLTELVDVDLLLERILHEARSIISAEAGSIYLRRKDKLVLAISQNDYLERGGMDHNRSELPFLNYILDINKESLAGYVTIEKKVLAIDNTMEIDPDAPFQHYTAIDNSTNYICEAVITLPLLCQPEESMGAIQLINPLDENGAVKGFADDDVQVLSFYVKSAALALEKAMMLRSMTLRSVEVISAHDPQETPAHAQRVACLASELYEHWAKAHMVPSYERTRILDHLPLAAMFHDIGKISVPASILTKPGRLDHQERALVEGHVLAGARLFRIHRTPLDKLTYQVILDHHERWDGQGYPGWVDLDTGLPLKDRSGPDGRARGKRGEEISIYGRILAVADVYDALVSRRSYKDSFDESLSIQIMEQESGRHFDPQVIESLMARKKVLKRIRDRYPDSMESLELTTDLPLARAPVAYPLNHPRM
ncbi:MAG: HD domain-containing protein [Deltaproteobacteria bacterium]|nr:HD domain-containing protein [Deltaproteobacteria bacterium]